MSTEEISEVNKLYTSFELAKASDTHESHINLLKKLTSSSNDIPGFTVGILPATYDHALTVASSKIYKKIEEAMLVVRNILMYE